MYTKELLVNVYLHRYRNLGEDTVQKLHSIADRFFDVAGRDKFRVYASVTPEAIREYKKFSLDA